MIELLTGDEQAPESGIDAAGRRYLFGPVYGPLDAEQLLKKARSIAGQADNLLAHITPFLYAAWDAQGLEDHTEPVIDTFTLAYEDGAIRVHAYLNEREADVDNLLYGYWEVELADGIPARYGGVVSAIPTSRLGRSE